MVAGVIVAGCPNLHALWVVALCDRIGPITLLARLRVAQAPDKLLGAGYRPVVLLYNFNALTQSIVRKLAAMRPAGDCCQSVHRVPFKRPRAVAGKISIGVINERFTSATG